MTDSSHAPVGSIDRSVLMAIDQRLKTAKHVRETVIALERETPTLTATFSLDFFAPSVEEAYYDIRWYSSGDFTIHYQENWTDDREWKRRWDKHPRNGSREHYHPPPDASQPPEPASYSNSYYDMMGFVERETVDHITHHPLLERDS